MRRLPGLIAAAAAALCLLFLTPPINAQTLGLSSGGDLEARLERLERMLNEQSVSDLVLQIQQIQQEVQDLRGQVEMQQYRLQQLDRSSGGFAGGGFDVNPRMPAAPGAEAPAGTQPGLIQPGSPGMTGTGTEAAAPAGAPAGAENQPITPVSPPPQQGVGAMGRGNAGGGLLALPTPETTAGGEREAYRAAFDSLKARDYTAAKKEFTSMLAHYPQGQFADNACYWLGEIGYVTKDYPAALTQFNRLIADFPLSPKVPSAMLKLGYVYYEQKDLEQARRLLNEVATRFPDTTEGRLAKGRLDQMTREGG